ncbi:MAG: hypothetical protein VXW15_00655 [Bdellovibrionota bacterium]|nr:hypothetical protein [Bdellovibrionota bacterium]|tara:strand:+ start:638 stop:943 length:306 start_codon:yes stop_codon:yes gene_type:complete
MKKLNTILFNFIFGTFFLLPMQAQAEYRVYQYFVKSKFNLPQDKEGHLVTSTLDPVSYIAYHGGRQSIEIDLLRTWVCKGHTGYFKKFCDSPLDKLKKTKI